MPQDDFRRETGQYYNKRNDEHKNKNDQDIANFIAQNSGHTVTELGISHPVGWLYTYMTLSAIVPSLDRASQRMSTAPAFEVNTRIDLRSEGNHTRIHSFTSSSTLNYPLLQHRLQVPSVEHHTTPIPHLQTQRINTTEVVLRSGSSTQMTPVYPQSNLELKVDIPEVAHEFSLSIHKVAHDIAELMNCTYTRRATQIKKWIFWGESIEQTNLKTVCQVAVAKAKKENDHKVKEGSDFHHFSFQQMSSKPTPEINHFKASTTIEKLIEIFQSAFENKQSQQENAFGTVNNRTGTSNNLTEATSDMTAPFWNGLTETFSHFFRQYEQTNYTKEPAGPSGESAMAHFVDLLVRIFSVTYEEHGPATPQTTHHRNLPMSTHPKRNVYSPKTAQKQSKKKKRPHSNQEKEANVRSEVPPVLKPEELSFLTQLYQLAEDFSGRVDTFLDRWDKLRFPGAEARPLPNVPKSEEDLPISNEPIEGMPYCISKDQQVQFSEKISKETLTELDCLIPAYMNGRLSEAEMMKEIPKNLPAFWYERSVFDKRSETARVSRGINAYICQRKQNCSQMTGRELLLVIQNWGKKYGAETFRIKRKLVAEHILKYSGLPHRELTDQQVYAILKQWRMNIILKDYAFKELKQTTLKEQMTTKATTITQKPVSIPPKSMPVTSTPTPRPARTKIGTQLEFSEKISEETLVKLNNLIMEFMHGKNFDSEIKDKLPENLPAFWYVRALFDERSKTEQVIQAVNVYICQRRETCSPMSGQELLLEIQSWKKKYNAETRKIRWKVVAELILEYSGLPNQELTEHQVVAILKQWRNNIMFKDYTFKEQMQTTLNEPTTSIPSSTTQLVPEGDAPHLHLSGNMTVEQRLKIETLIMKKIYSYMYSVRLHEKLPENLLPFWFDSALFGTRGEIERVNQAVNRFICHNSRHCKHKSDQELLLEIQYWEQTEKEENLKNKKQQVASIILQTSGLPSRELTDATVNAILMQWRNNIVFKDYPFKDIEQVNTQTTLTSNHPQTSTVKPRDIPKKSDGISPAQSNTTTTSPISQNPTDIEKFFAAQLKKVNNIVAAFLEGKPSPVPNTDKLLVYWYDQELYKKRNETPNVNEAVRKFLCEKKVPCEGLSILELILATQEWVRKEGKDLEVTRKRQVANIILSASGLSGQTVADVRASAILIQWRDNNIFKDFTFEENIPSAEIEASNSELVDTIISTRPNSYDSLPLDIATTINNMHLDYVNGRPLAVSIEEPLFPFWFDYELLQNRNKTVNANQFVQKFLYNKQIFSEDISPRGTVLSAHEWANVEQTDTEILANQKQLVPIILEGYGIVRKNLTDTDETNIYLQWEINNMLSNYQFIELKQPRLMENVTENSEMDMVPATTRNTDLNLVHKIFGNVNSNVIPETRYAEPLSLLYYHFGLFQRRNETNNVNKKLKEFFSHERIDIKDTSYSELEKALRQWFGKGETNEGIDSFSRKQFLAYFIAKAYGLTNIRLGEFLSSVKVQDIFNQWKANTLLEGYTYKEITPEMIHYQAVKTENPSVIRFNEQKKESNQLFSDFINDRSPSISNSQSLNEIYYHQVLFEQRENTQEVNEEVVKFLKTQGISLNDPSASELIRQVQAWILEGTTYSAILDRMKQIATLILQEYGFEEEVTAKEARYLLLQWENNNAQAGYTYKENSEMDVIDIRKVEATIVQQEKIDAFTRVNIAALTTDDIDEDKKKSTLELTEEQKQNKLKEIGAFLAARDINVDVSKPNVLVEKTVSWATLKVEGEDKIDVPKVKMLANVLLGKRIDAGISRRRAESVFKEWIQDMFSEEELPVTPTVSPKEEKTSPISVQEKEKPKYDAIDWRDPNLKVQIAQFFRQEGALKGEGTQTNILVAMSVWFTQEGTGMVLSYDKLQKLSKVILGELKLYGGVEGEKISDRMARLTLSKWVFENVLGSSVEAFILKNILNSPDTSQFTIGSLRKLFEIEQLNSGVNGALISTESADNVKKLWILLLKEVLPNYFLETSSLADELPISDYRSLMQLTGARLLEDAGIRTAFNQEEIQKFGIFYWEKISKDGLKSVEELRYLILPALFAVAQLNPDLLHKALEEGNYQEVALNTFMNYWRSSFFMMREYLEGLYKSFETYRRAMIDWRRKQALAKEVVQLCIKYDKEYTRLFTAYALEQDYLAGSKPCRNYPVPDLEELYTGLIKGASDAYYPLSQKLIEYALMGFDLKEQQFMFSRETQIYEATADLKSFKTVPSGPYGVHLSVAFIIQFQLQNTNLFVAVKGNEERWYALKSLDDGGGYVLYRVDKNPLLYLKYGLFDQKEIWSEGYRKDGDLILVGKRKFAFSSTINRDKKITQGSDVQLFIDTLARKHRDTFYQQLYDAGNDKAISDQILDSLMSIIPFYDCVTGVIEQDATKAIPSCVIDILLLIPFLGQVSSLNMKFALGLAKGIATGGIRQAVRQGGHFIPNISEAKSLLVHLVRYTDPGIEAISDGSKFILKELIDLKKEYWITSDVKKILEKAKSLVKETPTLPKDVSMAHLPGNGLSVPVKKMKDDSYRIVTDLKTSDVFGPNFWLRGNRLALFTEPVSFTAEQKALINRLTKDIKEDQIFANESNINPEAYGSGKVMSLSKKGEETKYFITMNGHTVPVRVKPDVARYDVMDGEKILPVNFDGKEWYFEPVTSPTVSKDLAEEVMKKINEFESIKDPNVLSPPYDQDLRWNSYGRSYIKINDYYIPLILINKKENRYHLVKKDMAQPRTILKFDPNVNTFRKETVEEMERAEHRMGVVWKQEGEKLPPPRTLLESPGRAQEWNQLRNAIDAEEELMAGGGVVVKENDNVLFTPIASFIPEPRPIVLNNEAWNKQNILDTITKHLPEEPKIDFRIYAGLDLSKVPDFLHPFYQELIKDYRTAQEYYQKVLDIFQGILKSEKLATTKQGQYLVKFFKLEEVYNQEAILLEIMKRLISIVQKGQQFLQLVADRGYENILVASTDLIRLKGSAEYRSLYHTYIGAKAVTFPPDPECRLIIFADGFHLDPQISKTEVRIDKAGTIIHETSHLTSKTHDIMKFSSPIIGEVKTAKMMIEEYHENYSGILESTGFKIFVKDIARAKKTPGLSKKTVWEELAKNDLLRVNLQISDAEMVMKIILDIATGTPFEGTSRVGRSLNDSILGKGILLTFLTLRYVADNDYFDKYIPLDKNKEQTTQTPSQTNVTTKENIREKREVAASTETNLAEEANRSFLNLRATCVGESNHKEQQTVKKSMKRSFLNLVVSSTEKSRMVNSMRDNHQARKAQKQFIPHY